MPSKQSVSEVDPHPETLERIKATIAKRDVRQLVRSEIRTSRKLSKRELILACILIALLLLTTQVSIIFSSKSISPDKLKVDCLAVLVNESNMPVLTILTDSKQRKLRLKWENLQQANSYKTQVWAQSRRDGLTQSLFTFNQAISNIEMPKEQHELIRNSSHLFIRQAATVAPQTEKLSYELTAQGSCVPFSNNAPNN